MNPVPSNKLFNLKSDSVFSQLEVTISLKKLLHSHVNEAKTLLDSLCKKLKLHYLVGYSLAYIKLSFSNTKL